MDETTMSPATCPDCHALVADLAAHAAWHQRLVHDLAVAVTQYDDRRGQAAPA